MKYLLLSLITLALPFSPSSVYAASSGKVIASVNTGGGMPGPGGGCYASHLDVFENGSVVETKCGKDPQVVITISSAIIAKAIAIEAAMVNPGQLVPQDPKRPECADAPSTIYSVVLANGTNVAVGGIVNCRTMVPRQPSYQSTRLSEFLKGIAELTYL